MSVSLGMQLFPEREEKQDRLCSSLRQTLRRFCIRFKMENRHSVLAFMQTRTSCGTQSDSQLLPQPLSAAHCEGQQWHTKIDAEQNHARLSWSFWHGNELACDDPGGIAKTHLPGLKDWKVLEVSHTNCNQRLCEVHGWNWGLHDQGLVRSFHGGAEGGRCIVVGVQIAPKTR